MPRKNGTIVDNDGENNDDDDDNTIRRHEVHRKKENTASYYGNDDDSEDEHDLAHHSSDSKKKDLTDSNQEDLTPVVNLNDGSFHDGVVSGMGSEISFVSKHGPAKFYWLKRSNRGSKDRTQM